MWMVGRITHSFLSVESLWNVGHLSVWVNISVTHKVASPICTSIERENLSIFQLNYGCWISMNPWWQVPWRKLWWISGGLCGKRKPRPLSWSPTSWREKRSSVSSIGQKRRARALGHSLSLSPTSRCSRTTSSEPFTLRWAWNCPQKQVWFICILLIKYVH